jgi:RHS repeat-associated protein
VAVQHIAPQQGGVLTYLHTDHLGNTSVASTASGALVARQTYFPYGAPRTSEGILPTDYTFTGQRVDTSAGLMYYGARYYDAALGRFIQPDLLIPDPYNPQSLNRYAYVYNNPLRYTDPTGHCPLCVAAFAYAKIVLMGTGINPISSIGKSIGEHVRL